MYYAADVNASDYIGILDRRNYDKKWDKITRVAIRGIIESDGKIALIHSGKHGDYKFPAVEWKQEKAERRLSFGRF